VDYVIVKSKPNEYGIDLLAAAVSILPRGRLSIAPASREQWLAVLARRAA
jgi:predicted RNA-binding protein with PUA-like domain